MTEERVASVHEEYASVAAVQKQALQRIHELEGRGAAALLTDDEEDEVLRLKARVERLAPQLESLTTQVAHAKVELDIAAVVATWDQLVAAKRDAYQRLFDAVCDLRDAISVLRQVHRAQVAAVEKLPRAVAARVSFPDAESMITRVAGGLVNPNAWHALFGAGGLTVSQAQANEIVASDPGCTALSPRALDNFVQGR